jgi:hypothetical protein
MRRLDRGVDRQQTRLPRDPAQLVEERADLRRPGFHRAGERGGLLDGRHQRVQPGEHRVDAAVVVARGGRERTAQRAQASGGLRDARRAAVDLGDRGSGALDVGALVAGVARDAVKLVGVQRRHLGGRLDDAAEGEHLGPQPVHEGT